MDNKSDILSNRQGFTLLEMLIAITIFSIMVGAVAGIYVSFTKLQARAKAYERLQNDTNYALEFMAREFRAGTVFDYTPNDSCDPNLIIGLSNPTECIALQREDGTLELFTIYTENGIRALYFITPTINVLTGKYEWATDPKKFSILLAASLDSIVVEPNGFQFKISPTSDPFVDGSSENRQPMITIQLKTKYVGGRTLEMVTQTAQTTISTRVYKR